MATDPIQSMRSHCAPATAGLSYCEESFFCNSTAQVQHPGPCIATSFVVVNLHSTQSYQPAIVYR